MSLYWGVYPVAMPKFSTVDELLLYAERLALKSGFMKKGEKIVITSGAHGRKNDITKLVEVRQV
jgi:pyruvate kinase